MTVYEKLRRRPAVFRSLTGVSIGEFETLHQNWSMRLNATTKRAWNGVTGSGRWGPGGGTIMMRATAC